MGNMFGSINQIDEDVMSGLGPRGTGDPNDFSLREKEIHVNIPNYQWQAADKVKCKHFCESYEECAENSVLPIISCHEENIKWHNCVQHWAHDLKYREEITAEYLLLREEFRKTGRRRLYRGLKGETYVTKDQLYGFQL